MKIRRVLNISSEEFYNYLEQQFIVEFTESTKQSIIASDIKKGLSYQKQLSNAQSIVTIEILEYIRNHIYKSRINYNHEVVILSYETEVIGNKLNVTFDQDIKSMNNPNMFKYFKLFSEAVYLGRMTNSLYDIQSQIHKAKSI